MTRLTAKDFEPELLALYDGYVHGRLSRRDFLDRAARFAVGGSRPRDCWRHSRPTTRWPSR